MCVALAYMVRMAGRVVYVAFVNRLQPDGPQLACVRLLRINLDFDALDKQSAECEHQCLVLSSCGYEVRDRAHFVLTPRLEMLSGIACRRHSERNSDAERGRGC